MRPKFLHLLSGWITVFVLNWNTLDGIHFMDKINYFAKHLDGPALLWWSAVRDGFLQDINENTYEQIIDVFKKYFIDPNYMAIVRRIFFGMKQSNTSIAGYVTFLWVLLIN